MLTVLPIIFMSTASALPGTLLPQVHVLVDDRGHEVVGLVPPRAGEADGAGVEPAGVAVVLHGHLLGPAPHIPGQDGLVWTLHRSGQSNMLICIITRASKEPPQSLKALEDNMLTNTFLVTFASASQFHI